MARAAFDMREQRQCWKACAIFFSSGPVPYADSKASIPLGEVLQRDWFELWYQPKIELKSMHLVGAEALVRARHPTRGIVPPFLFLPVPVKMICTP